LVIEGGGEGESKGLRTNGGSLPKENATRRVLRLGGIRFIPLVGRGEGKGLATGGREKKIEILPYSRVGAGERKEEEVGKRLFVCELLKGPKKRIKKNFPLTGCTRSTRTGETLETNQTKTVLIPPGC